MIYVKEIIFGFTNIISATCSSENGKYFESIIDNSVIMYDQIIDTDAEAKSNNIQTKNIQENTFSETKDFCILIAFLLITMHY